MTSLVAKVALAAILTVASVIGLVGLSGLIIFADLQTPDPTAIAQERISGAGHPVTFTGPN